MLINEIFGRLNGKAFDTLNRREECDISLNFSLDDLSYSLTGSDTYVSGKLQRPRDKGFLRFVDGNWLNSEDYDNMFLRVFSKIRDFETKGNLVRCENLSSLNSKLYRKTDELREISSLLAGETGDTDIWPSVYHTRDHMFDSFREYYQKLIRTNEASVQRVLSGREVLPVY